jgi:hypothetical protein
LPTLKVAREPKLFDDIMTFLHRIRHRTGNNADSELIV